MGKEAPSFRTPCVLLGRDGQKRIVVSADGAARRQGITVGMPATQAQALVANLHVSDADIHTDAEAIDRLAQWAQRRYSPVIATDSDGLMIDATGCAHLFGGEEAMLTDLVTRLRAARTSAIAVMASTYGAAHALARFTSHRTIVVNAKDTEMALNPLPIAALRLPAQTVTGLKKLGFETIADVKATPRPPLALRFGSEIGRRLDEALGMAFEPFDLVQHPDAVFIQRSFAEPIAAPETITRYIGILTESICATMELKVLGARCLDLLFHRVDSSFQSIRIGLAKPVRDVKRLSRLLTDKLDTIDPGFGIEVMRLSASWVEPLILKQQHLSVTGKQRPEMDGLIDTLRNRLGQGRIYKLAPVESDIPERSTTKAEPLAALRKNRWPKHWPRPARLFFLPRAD